MKWLYVLGYLLLAPFVGGLLAGVDRKISARMQGRFGPPVLQPFYDVSKLFRKEFAVVNKAETFLVIMFLLFMMVTGALFFMGGDLLLVIFALTLSSIFLLIAAYSTNSPYSNLGADRELLAMMAYEPMILFTAMGFYLIVKSFSIPAILGAPLPAVLYMPGLFVGFVFILTFKFRKSPFDISTSHHAHQELVKGLTTEFVGPTLALVELAHWYENVMLLGFVYLFFSWSAGWSPVVAVAACLLTYFFEILVDNTFARVRWKMALGTTWVLTATAGFLNVVILSLILWKVPMKKIFRRSPWVIHYNGSSCNGCDIEVLACLTPLYDLERFGIVNTGNPKHADILLVTGTVNTQGEGALRQIYEQMPNPKAVVAVGICATGGGVFADCYNVLGEANKAVPVDVYVPGCAARPESIIDGVVKAALILDERCLEIRNARKRKHAMGKGGLHE